ncbi:hypothetical protein JCM12298_29100 [Desulfothermus naphthae]
MMKRFILIITIIFCLSLFSGGVIASNAKSEVKTPLPMGLSKDTQFIIYYMDKRFDALYREMDKRFEQVDKRFEQVDKRFEQVDKRFEQVDKRFEQIMNFLWMLTGIFTTLTAAVIAFAFWDRRTIIRQARNEAIERIEKEGRLQNLIEVLRTFAKKNSEFAEILKSFNLL